MATNYKENIKQNGAIHMNGISSKDSSNLEKDGLENKERRKPNILKRASDKIVTILETAFSKLGRLIGNNPVKTLILCTLLAGMCGVGMLKFSETNDNQTIWVPAESDVIRHKTWVEDKFPPSTRFVNMIFEADNILTPTGLKAMLDIYNKTKYFTTPNGNNISTLCQVAAFGRCFVTSILELWAYNETQIHSLSASDIFTKINNVQISPSFQTPYDLTNQIGGRTKADNGSVISAKAANMLWILLGDNEEESKAWEELAIKTAQQERTDVQIYVYATRSFSDVGGNAILSDVSFLSAGYFLVIFYLTIVLGRFNCIEQRAWLAFCGICVIGLSILCSFGISYAAGWEYGPLHSVLPFLLLGIGVDDVFVIVGALSSLSKEEASLSVPERISYMLKHAGVSITVTSLTDIVAFGIGATTALPALKSFCIFATIGILALYLLSATFFVAGVTLDIRRIDAYRNACCCCKHGDSYKTNNCSKRELLSSFIGQIYAPFLLKVPVKVIVILITLGILGLNIWGTINLKQEFDSRWFLPTDSYASKYFEKDDLYFPNDGESAAVYCGNIDYYNRTSDFEDLVRKLSSSPYVNNGTVDSWFQGYKDFLSGIGNNYTDITNQLDNNFYPVNKSAFINILQLYIAGNRSWAGLRYERNLAFSQDRTNIDASYIPFEHSKFENSAEQIQGMDNIQSLVKEIIPECFTYGREYLQWYTDKIIQRELYRNLGLAAGCVFIVTFILIANLWTSLMVFTCVVGTLVDVAGCMHFWGLTIDTVTSIILILAIGLAVDYSAHIGHCFMTVQGTRNDRAKATLVEIGSPVFSGGFSTFLAFILLVASNSYVFTTFFKVFLLVVIFGLFHGLIYLPTLLSWIGPLPYSSASRQLKEDANYDNNTNQNSLHGVDNQAFEISRKDAPPPDYETIDYDHIGHGHPYIPPPDYTPPPSRSAVQMKMQKRNSNKDNSNRASAKNRVTRDSAQIQNIKPSTHNGIAKIDI